MIDMSNYNVYQNKDGRYRAYNKTTHKVTSYPRVLMEAILGRQLLPTEDVHHKDEDYTNNDPSNLEVIDHREHDRLHGGRNRKYEKQLMICPICKKEFIWTEQQQSRFYEKERSGGPFCSNKCKGINNQKVQAEKGLATKYEDKIAICAGCGKPFLYTAKSQRDRRPETKNKPYCSIECVYKSNTKYTKELLLIIQAALHESNGSFATVEKELNIPRGRLGRILKRHNLPYHSADYKKHTA